MNKTRLKMFAICLTLVLVLSSSFACSDRSSPLPGDTASTPSSSPIDSSTDEPKPTSPDPSELKIGLVIAELGDNSISDMIYEGVKAAQAKYGFTMDYTECDVADMPTVMIDYTKTQEYDLIVLLSYHAMGEAIEMQHDYPDQKYLIYDVDASGNPNIMSESFAKNQMGFVAGVFAALMDAEGEAVINGEKFSWEPSGKFGAMIGVEMPNTVGSITGFYAGVNFINPDAEILYTSVGNWFDQTTAKELALTTFHGGANIMFHNAGGAFFGAVEAAKTAGTFVIGYDANQNDVDATRLLGSTHKQNVDVLIRFFDDFVNGMWEPGIDILNGYHNDGAAFTYQEGLEIPRSVQEIMDSVINAITTGEIVPPNSWEELEAFDLTYEG